MHAALPMKAPKLRSKRRIERVKLTLLRRVASAGVIRLNHCRALIRARACAQQHDRRFELEA